MFLQKMFDKQLLDNFLVDISFWRFFPYNLFFKFLFINLLICFFKHVLVNMHEIILVDKVS